MQGAARGGAAEARRFFLVNISPFSSFFFLLSSAGRGRKVRNSSKLWLRLHGRLCGRDGDFRFWTLEEHLLYIQEDE